MNEELNKINNELKVYMNEAGFISNRCRDKVIRMFAKEFSVSLDVDLYQNVDLSITRDFKVLYRGDLYNPSPKINSLSEVLERYQVFKEEADHLLARKSLSFESRSNWNNISNLILIGCLFLAFLGIIYIGIMAFLAGNYFDCLWFVFILIPAIVPRFKSSLEDRLIQAKNYIKSLRKKM